MNKRSTIYNMRFYIGEWIVKERETSPEKAKSEYAYA
jgi:hypothetical protein